MGDVVSTLLALYTNTDSDWLLSALFGVSHSLCNAVSTIWWPSATTRETLLAVIIQRKIVIVMHIHSDSICKFVVTLHYQYPKFVILQGLSRSKNSVVESIRRFCC